MFGEGIGQHLLGSPPSPMVFTDRFLGRQIMVQANIRTKPVVVISIVLGMALAACGSSEEKMPASREGKSVSEVAQYSGSDRQAYLEKCAADEGSLTLYTSQNPELWEPEAAAFKKRYPKIKVHAFRAPTGDVLERFTQEEEIKRGKADVVAVKADGMLTIADYLTPFESPETAAYPESAVSKDKKHVVSENNVYGLAYNTDVVAPDEVPKTTEDLLDPKWRGKMVLSSSTFGVDWVGLITHKYGKDMVKKLGKQKIHTQNITSGAMAELMASGEGSLSPSVSYASVRQLQEEGAPLGWTPLDAISAVGEIGLSARSPHPCAGMLYIDFVLSRQGQRVAQKAYYVSARKDLPSKALHDVVPLDLLTITDDYNKSYEEWADLFDRYIVAGA